MLPACPFSTCYTPEKYTFRREHCNTMYYYYYVLSGIFFGIQKCSLPVAGMFSRSRLRGTQGARLYKTVQVWAPAGLHDACSGRLKSLNLACNHGVPFRGARAKQDNGKHTNQNANFSFLRSAALLLHQLQVPHRPSKCVYFDVATVQQQPRFKLFPL